MRLNVVMVYAWQEFTDVKCRDVQFQRVQCPTRRHGAQLLLNAGLELRFCGYGVSIEYYVRDIVQRDRSARELPNGPSLQDETSHTLRQGSVLECIGQAG